MGLGLTGLNSTTLPANYQNSLYWQYFMATMQNYQKQQQAQFAAKQQQIAVMQQQQQAQLAQQQALQAQQTVPQTATTPQTTQSVTGYNPADGLDDGHISFGSKLKNMGKGVVNFFKGMVCDKDGKFSIGQTLKTVAIAGAAVAVSVATGGAAVPFLVGAGVAMGGFQVAKGAYNAATAKTDAEAEAAWQNIGEGATGIGLSIAGAKGGLKAAKVDVSGYKGITGAFKATGKTFKYCADTSKAGLDYVRSEGVLSSIKTGYSTAKENFTTNWESAFKSTNAKENAKSQMTNEYEALLQTYERDAQALLKDLVKFEKNPAKNAEKIAQTKNKLASIYHEQARLQRFQNNLPENIPVADNRVRISELDNDIQNLQAELAEYKQLYPEADLSSLQAELTGKMNYRAKLNAQQTPAGARNAQIDRLEVREKMLKDIIKNTKDKSTKSAYEEQLRDIQLILKNSKEFQKIEAATQEIEILKGRLPKINEYLEAIKTKLENVKNDNTLSNEAKTEQLVELGSKQLRLEAILKTTKTRINSAKHQLYWRNAKAYEAANRGALRNPTVALASGEVVTYDTPSVDENGLTPEQAQAFAQYQASMQQAQNTSNIAATTNPYTQQLGMSNPYGSSSIFTQAPTGTGLEYQDLYQSPYQGLV